MPFGGRSSEYVRKEWFDQPPAIVSHDAKGSPLPIDQTAQSIGRAVGPRAVSSPRRFYYAKFLIEVIDPKPQNDLHLSASSLKQMMTGQVEVVKAGDDIVSWGALVAALPASSRECISDMAGETRVDPGKGDFRVAHRAPSSRLWTVA